MKKVILSFIAVVVLGLLWWNQSSNKAPATGEPIKIGQMSGLSGVGADIGEEERNGALLAV